MCSCSGGRDCLTPAAIVFKTAVQDADSDGLLDAWDALQRHHQLFRPPRPEAASSARLDGRSRKPEGSLRRDWLHGRAAPVDMDGNPDNASDTVVIWGCPATRALAPSQARSVAAGWPGLQRRAPVPNRRSISISAPSTTPMILYPTCDSSFASCVNHYIIGRRHGREHRERARGRGCRRDVDDLHSVGRNIRRGSASTPLMLASPRRASPARLAGRPGFRYLKDKVFSVTPTPRSDQPANAAGQLL